MDIQHLNRLNPENLKIDERNLPQLILYVKELSKVIPFYNLQNKIDGSWYDILKYDLTFLLTEIYAYPITSFGAIRTESISKFDESSKKQDKWKIYYKFCQTTFDLFSLINEWYLRSKKNNLSIESSPLEYKLEKFIVNELSTDFENFIEQRNAYLQIEDSSNTKKELLKEYSKIWFSQKNADTEILKMTPEYAMKKLVLTFNSLYSKVFHLMNDARILYERSVDTNQNHKAHIGLLMSFFKIFNLVQNDINEITTKHIDLFFKEILNQKQLDVTPSTIFGSIELNKNVEELRLSKGQIIKAGQFKDGTDILFETTSSFTPNNAVLNHISTNYLSRSKTFEYNSRYNLVSGIFTKIHASSLKEVKLLNENSSHFSSLGEEQKLYTEREMNMDFVDIGFVIATSCLQMGKTKRSITVDIFFDDNSITYLSDLIIDISNNLNSTEEVVFKEVFDNAFILNYTSAEGWEDINNYNVHAPEDWTTGKISITFELNKNDKPFANLSPSIHGNINTSFPVLKFCINQKNFYNSYSFLNGMKINQIDIYTEVSDLRNFNILTNLDSVDPNSSFEMFGPRPRLGSSLLIGSEELFNKNIDELSISWEINNLPVEHDNLDSYYKSYGRNLNNSSFKFTLSALSDYHFKDGKSLDFNFNVFEEDENSKLLPKREINDINIRKFNIIPNYHLHKSDIQNYSHDIETGYLKLELTEPKIGFGFDTYHKVYANTITENALRISTKSKENQLELPSEPFSPEISNISIGYKSSTSIVFNQKNFSNNNLDEKNSFHLITPYGIIDSFKDNKVYSDSIVYNLQFEGELILGFDNCNYPKTLNLIFEILKSNSTNYEFSRKIEWFYYSSEGWKQLPLENLMNDETHGLMKTGVVSIKIPEDISLDANLFGGNSETFFKICSKDKSDQFSLIKSIRTNGISAKEVLNKNPENRINVLPPNSIKGFRENINEIISIKQFLPSIPGRQKENKLDYYLRVSELIRHKNRPVTKWDYEKVVLHKFPWLSHVKCFSSNEQEDRSILKLLCIKRIDKFQNVDDVKLGASEIQEIEEYLKKVSSAFAKIQVVNPVFEDLWLKCKIIFKNTSNGHGIEALSNHLFEFLCPWINPNNKNQNLKQKIKLIDIINFIKSHEYVDFVTSLSFIHLKATKDLKIEVCDSASDSFDDEYIKTGLPWSLIVPKGNHKIQVIQNKNFSTPEPIEYKELGINSSFFVQNEKVKRDKKKLTRESIEKSVSFKFKI